MIRTFIDLWLAEGDAEMLNIAVSGELTGSRFRIAQVATATCQEPGRGEEGR